MYGYVEVQIYAGVKVKVLSASFNLKSGRSVGREVSMTHSAHALPMTAALFVSLCFSNSVSKTSEVCRNVFSKRHESKIYFSSLRKVAKNKISVFCLNKSPVTEESKFR